MRPRVVLIGALGLTLTLLPWASVRIADRLALAAVDALARVVPKSTGAPRSAVVVPYSTPALLAKPEKAGARSGRAARRKPGRRSLPDAPKRGLRVSARMVRELARRGVRPTAHFVAADGVRPAGLILHGVSALGVGLRDGDVLTQADGRAALSVADVVAAIIAARAAGAREIGGRFWRDGEAWSLAVEQPYGN